MSHHFKAPLSLAEREIRRWAQQIDSIEELDRVVSQAQPMLRRAVFERIRPFLRRKIEAEQVPCLNPQKKIDGGELYRRFLAGETPEQLAESCGLDVKIVQESLRVTDRCDLAKVVEKNT